MSSKCHSKKERKALIKIIEKDGWVRVKGGKGGHANYKHPIKKGKITVPLHITRNIELSVMRQAGLR